MDHLRFLKSHCYLVIIRTSYCKIDEYFSLFGYGGWNFLTLRHCRCFGARPGFRSSFGGGSLQCFRIHFQRSPRWGTRRLGPGMASGFRSWNLWVRPTWGPGPSPWQTTALTSVPPPSDQTLHSCYPSAAPAFLQPSHSSDSPSLPPSSELPILNSWAQSCTT